MYFVDFFQVIIIIIIDHNAIIKIFFISQLMNLVHVIPLNSLNIDQLFYIMVKCVFGKDCYSNFLIDKFSVNFSH